MSKKENELFKNLVSNIRYVNKEAVTTDKWFAFDVPAYAISSVLAPLGLVFMLPLVIQFVSDGTSLKDFAIYLCIAIAIYGVFVFVQSLSITRIGLNATQTRLTKGWPEFGKKCMECDYSHFEPGKYSDMRAAAERSLDSNWIGYELALRDFPLFLGALLGSLAYAVWTAFISPWVFLLLVGMALAHVLLTFWSQNQYNKDKDKEGNLEKVGYYYTDVAKDSKMGKDIRNYRLQPFISEKNSANSKAYGKMQNHFARLLMLPSASDALFMVGRDILAYAILIGLYLDGQITLSSFSLMIGIVTGFSTFLSTAVTKFSSLVNCSEHISRYREFLDLPDEMKREGGLDPKALPTPVTIEFRHVSFKYPDSDKWIIHDLNLLIKPGEKLALVGVNGAGKTTIVKLLSGLYYPTEGDILIDGKSLKDLDIEKYYSSLSVINQDSEAFPYSVKTNVIGNSAWDQAQFDKALTQAGIKDVVDRLPKKEETFLTTDLDPKGVNLSGGQVQKLLLARALYRDGKILILDEPTAALDPIAESELYQEYGSLTVGKTSVFISHRLASTRFCDRIILLEQGQIIEEGTHEELLRKGGEYAKMFAVQAHYYKEGNREEGNI